MLGIGIFAFFMVAVGLTILSGQEDTVMGGDRIRAAHIGLQGLEVSRSIRDGNFSSLTIGKHGIGLSGGTWVWNGTQTTMTGGYTTNTELSVLMAGEWMNAKSTTTWKRSFNRSGSVVLHTDITNWRPTVAIGNWNVLTLTGSVTVANAFFNDIVVTDTHAFVASETSGGGAGLYVVAIGNLTAPVITTTVAIGAPVYELTLRGKTLYLVTGDANAEIKAYDITIPAAPTLLTSYNLPGSGRARSIAVWGDTLYVGGIPNGAVGERAIYSFDIRVPGALTLFQNLDDVGTAFEMAVHKTGTAAYIADSHDTGELRVVTLGSSGSMTVLGGFNLTDGTWDGQSVAVSGTSALLGREKNAQTELILFDVRRGVVPSTPGQWYHEGSGSLVGVDLDGKSCYGFVAAKSGRKALQVVRVQDKTLTELATYNSTTGEGRGLLYDPTRDKVFLLTDSAMLVFRPSGTTNAFCSS